MAWNDHFLTGLEAIDRQHSTLVDLINQLAPILDGKEAAAEAVALLVDRTIIYANTHFAFEEGAMLNAGLEPTYVKEHAMLHAAFVDEVTELQRQQNSSADFDGSHLLRFLTGWLTFHILGADKEMARQGALIQAGASPTAALATVRAARREDPAAAVLNDALLDLFRLNVERNRALGRANSQLTRARSELAIVNESLELQVQARTDALVRANAELEDERNTLTETLAELRRTETALLHAEKLRAIGQLAAGVAHEINTPLQFVGDCVAFVKESISALLEMQTRCASLLKPSADGTAEFEALAERLDVDYLVEHLPSAIGRAQEGLEIVAGLVSAMKDFARPDPGTMESADLNHALANCLVIAHGQISDAVHVTAQYGDLPPIRCHIGELRQVFLNLLINAADAIREHKGGTPGRLEVGTAIEGDRALVWFRDEGGGVPEGVAGRIFEPFFTTKGVGRGSGQGLAISRAIVVEKHGGELDFTTTPGHGSTFFVRIPVRR